MRSTIQSTLALINPGKFIENTRDHMVCKLVKTKRQMMKWASCPRYISFKKITPKLYAVFLRPRKLVLRQCWAIGFTILDVAKAIVYDHFYNRIRPALGYRVTVAFSDTGEISSKSSSLAIHLSLPSLCC